MKCRCCVIFVFAFLLQVSSSHQKKMSLNSSFPFKFPVQITNAAPPCDVEEILNNLLEMNIRMGDAILRAKYDYQLSKDKNSVDEANGTLNPISNSSIPSSNETVGSESQLNDTTKETMFNDDYPQQDEPNVLIPNDEPEKFGQSFIKEAVGAVEKKWNDWFGDENTFVADDIEVHFGDENSSQNETNAEPNLDVPENVESKLDIPDNPGVNIEGEKNVDSDLSTEQPIIEENANNNESSNIKNVTQSVEEDKQSDDELQVVSDDLPENSDSQQEDSDDQEERDDEEKENWGEETSNNDNDAGWFGSAINSLVSFFG